MLRHVLSKNFNLLSGTSLSSPKLSTVIRHHTSHIFILDNFIRKKDLRDFSWHVPRVLYFYTTHFHLIPLGGHRRQVHLASIPTDLQSSRSSNIHSGQLRLHVHRPLRPVCNILEVWGGVGFHESWWSETQRDPWSHALSSRSNGFRVFIRDEAATGSWVVVDGDPT